MRRMPPYQHTIRGPSKRSRISPLANGVRLIGTSCFCLILIVTATLETRKTTPILASISTVDMGYAVPTSTQIRQSTCDASLPTPLIADGIAKRGKTKKA